jgi:hypothetical protein
MPPKERTDRPQDVADGFELMSREDSFDGANGANTLRTPSNDGARTSLHRRTRFSLSEPPSRSRDEEFVGLLRRSTLEFPRRLHLSGGWAVALELVTQSTPSLLAAVVGSVMTGVVFDTVQYWPAFVRIVELFILVPVLLNLKGCLEMNLASRLSTSVLTLLSPGLTLGKHW